MKIRAGKLPIDPDDCGWWKIAPAPAGQVASLASDQSADAVVIGAGFTGLAVARRLAERRPQDRILLLEAQRVGFGSSGRNSGFLGDIAHRDPGHSMEETARSSRLCRFGVESLERLWEQHEFDCDWIRCGRVHAAVEKSGLKSFEHLLPFLQQAGEAHRVLTPDEMQAGVGTRYYKAAVLIESTVLVQPVMLARGLARTLPDNVSLFEETPVLGMERDGGWRVRTKGGRVSTKSVFLAVNGFAPGLGVLRSRMFPLMTYASFTPRLTPQQHKLTGEWPQWGIAPEDRIGTTLRKTADGRILVRSIVNFAPRLRASAGRMRRVRASHHRSLAARFPGLAGCQFEHTWGGVMGLTMNQGHFFGQLGPDLYGSLAYNGVGMALGTASGTLLADLSRGEESSLLEDIRKLRKPAWLPPAPFLGIGVRAYTTFLERRAGGEV